MYYWLSKNSLTALHDRFSWFRNNITDPAGQSTEGHAPKCLFRPQPLTAPYPSICCPPWLTLLQHRPIHQDQHLLVPSRKRGGGGVVMGINLIGQWVDYIIECQRDQCKNGCKGLKWDLITVHSSGLTWNYHHSGCLQVWNGWSYQNLELKNPEWRLPRLHSLQWLKNNDTHDGTFWKWRKTRNYRAELN